MERFLVTENFLQNEIVVILHPVEMAAVLQVHTIMHISIGLNSLQLTTNTHELGEQKWVMFFIVQVVDKLYAVCIEIQKDGRKIFDKDFIKNIFDETEKYIPE